MTPTPRLAALLVVLILVVPLPSSATAGSEPLARIDDASALLRTGRIADAVRAAAMLAAVTPQPVVAVDHGITVIDRLAAAVATADAAARLALAGAPLVDGFAFDQLLTRASLTPPDPDAVSLLTTMWHEVEARVDAPLLYGASLMLAETIDAALPQLRTIPSTGLDGAACDVIDLLPRLCVGGAGDNTYTADAALLIDLGGNDLHTHSAGAGNPLYGGVAASVTIDLAGNDRYERAAGPAQGAGNLGIGVLVDAAGDDLYSIATTAGNVATVGQGSNHSSGVGILADLDGADTYSITNTKRDQTTASGQGRGTQPGFGLLLDHGIADDTYVVSAHQPGPIESPTEVKIGGMSAGGQGQAALGGVGILSDDGGTDTMTIEAIAATISPEESRPVTSVPIMGPSGLGAGSLGGAALHRTGPGNTQRRAVGFQQGPWAGITGASVYGWASGGVGALLDEGGDDTYSAEVSTIGSRRVAIDDTCSCTGADATAKQSLPNWVAASVTGMGFGSGSVASAGLGVLRDLDGDDRYHASALALVEAHVADARTTGAAGASSARATANLVTMNVQGVGLGGDGLLIDEAGDDIYEATAASRAIATASAVRGDVALTASAISERVFTDAQASGNALGGVPGRGVLRDLGGSDTYRSSSESTATATPATDVRTNTVLSSAQASVNANSVALLQDVDESAADTFALTPADPACTGTRGQGEWQDCGSGVGVGRVEDR